MCEVKRCVWANPKNPLYVAYHDNEWGKPSYDDKYMFEMLILEGFQAGLSWECVLNKRQAFSEAFDNFDYCKVANYTQDKMDELAQNKAIIRNRLKIKAAVINANVFCSIRAEYGTFSNYIWRFADGKQIVNRDGIIRASTPLSDSISKDLQKRGMKFVGTTIVYSFLQAIGIVDDHEPTCDWSK
ncbi:MAG: DNA-3-methyladenine glycosylase I [Corallococcus sp.]|nr:DNA-3-methyladenine glycosylase I [Corallococcus sp.]